MKRKKNQLPSGSIRIRVYDGTDENGKKIYRSFTAATKAGAQAMANEWKVNRKENVARLTLNAACAKYIELKSAVLSPATIRGYMFNQKRIAESSLGKMELSKISSNDVQRFISELTVSLSPKTVANTYGFITAVMGVYAPFVRFNVSLPKRQRARLYMPNDSDIQALLDACQTTELKLAILFAAVGTMRRGEACALTFNDVDFERCTISVTKSMVETAEHEWIIKAPKTYESDRIIRMPDYIIDMIRSLGRANGTILNMTPTAMYAQFRKLVSACELPHFRYHDLRHYAASQMHAAGVPERYIEAIGGWRPGSNVLKRTYENIIDLELERQERRYLDSHAFNV